MPEAVPTNRRCGEGWPPHLAQLRVCRGQEFCRHVEDPLDWHRTGLYQYVVVGWDAEVQLYEAWEASGLHTGKFSEAEVLEGAAALTSAAPGALLSWWAEGELASLPPLQPGSGRPRARARDKVFAPRLAGWSPYGTLEMAGPMLFQLISNQPTGTVCDIGAGTGRMAAWLTGAWGMEVSALDVVLPTWPEFEVLQFDGRRLPLGDKSVDVATFAFVLHHCRHFELQRALLSEAARVARRWIFVAEDTPADERDRRAAKGHDSLGQFHSVAAWRLTFRKLRLRLVHDAPLWEGPKHKPSPYRCTRRYFVLEVPEGLCPEPAAGVGGLVGCSCTVAEVADLSEQWLPGDAAAEAAGGQDAIAFTSFTQLKLPPDLQNALASQGFKEPTPVQRAAIPVALKGDDLVAVAKTGSGKTLAYLLPAVLRWFSAGAAREPFVLVLCPTRELALQIASAAEALLGPSGEAVVALFGGGSRWDQREKLEQGASILAATPGRLLDLACEAEERGRMLLSTVQVLVLDEGDRMLEEGLNDQLDALARRTAAARQTLFFSATWPESVGELAQRLCRRAPTRVSVDVASVPGVALANANIEQQVEVFDGDEEDEGREALKRTRLQELLAEVLGPEPAAEAQEGKALIFCTTRKFADALAEHLTSSGWPAVAVHGGKAQAERLQSLESFACGRSRALVATDVLGRGIDIPRVTHVFVYDFPATLEEYVHRIGRTARGVGGRGRAVAFFEWTPSLPGLARELAAHLEAAGQPVPPDLLRIAAEVEAGTRKERPWRVKVEEGSGAAAEGADQVWLPLARPEELGDGWNAGGQRSWFFCEAKLCQPPPEEPTGWLVFRTGGRLETCEGLGSWHLGNDEHIVVQLGPVTPRHYELKLHRWWEGRRREHFTSVVDNVANNSALTGWVTRSKVYRFKESVEAA